MGYAPGDPADGLPSLEATLRSARVIMVGSEHLAAWARRVSDSDVLVLAPSLDLRRYRRSRRHEGVSRPVVCWVGTSGNHRDLEVVRDALCALVEDGTVRFRVISDRPLNASDWPGAEWRPWSLTGEIAELACCDIGIMPLVDNERTRGRCGYKAVQYQAVGLPVGASPVGGAADALRDGRTGVLASTERMWRDALTRLAGDEARRATLGPGGRAHVGGRHSIHANVARLAAVLRSAQPESSRTDRSVRGSDAA